MAQQAADDVCTGAIPASQEAVCLAALGAAQTSLARDDLPAAQRLLDQAAGGAAGHLPGEPSVAVIGALIQARVLLADGNPAAARTVLSRLREGPAPACPGLSGAGLSGTAAAAEAETALRAGDPGAARALLRSAEDSGPGTGDPARAGLLLARAGLLLAEGEFAAARDAAAACLCRTDVLTVHERTRALLAAAVADRRLGDMAQAAAGVADALGLAEPEGAYRVFLDGGLAVRSAVTVLVPPTSRYAGFAGRIL